MASSTSADYQRMLFTSGKLGETPNIDPQKEELHIPGSQQG